MHGVLVSLVLLIAMCILVVISVVLGKGELYFYAVGGVMMMAFIFLIEYRLYSNRRREEKIASVDLGDD